MFSTFIIILVPPTIVNSVVPKFFQNLALWEAREHPSRTYGWVAYCTACVVAEIVMLFFLFVTSWGQWICAFAPSYTVISNVLPFFFVMFSLFNGIMEPYSLLNVFWKNWIYWVNPATWWVSGTISAALANVAVECAPAELARFNPPPGQTCVQYAGEYVRALGVGSLTNPSATADCGFCQYANGVEYMATLNIMPEDKWRDFGVFLVFCVTNWMLVYFFVWTVRVKGWTFGFGPLFRGLEKLFKRGSKE
jgi:ATP-binding cassette subfamily G (WHITE) protein 2 (SNQ2)